MKLYSFLVLVLISIPLFASNKNSLGSHLPVVNSKQQGDTIVTGNVSTDTKIIEALRPKAYNLSSIVLAQKQCKETTTLKEQRIKLIRRHQAEILPNYFNTLQRYQDLEKEYAVSDDKNIEFMMNNTMQYPHLYPYVTHLNLLKHYGTVLSLLSDHDKEISLQYYQSNIMRGNNSVDSIHSLQKTLETDFIAAKKHFSVLAQHYKSPSVQGLYTELQQAYTHTQEFKNDYIFLEKKEKEITEEIQQYEALEQTLQGHETTLTTAFIKIQRWFRGQKGRQKAGTAQREKRRQAEASEVQKQQAQLVSMIDEAPTFANDFFMLVDAQTKQARAEAKKARKKLEEEEKVRYKADCDGFAQEDAASHRMRKAIVNKAKQATKNTEKLAKIIAKAALNDSLLIIAQHAAAKEKVRKEQEAALQQEINKQNIQLSLMAEEDKASQMIREQEQLHRKSLQEITQNNTIKPEQIIPAPVISSNNQNLMPIRDLTTNNSTPQTIPQSPYEKFYKKMLPIEHRMKQLFAKTHHTGNEQEGSMLDQSYNQQTYEEYFAIKGLLYSYFDALHEKNINNPQYLSTIFHAKNALVKKHEALKKQRQRIAWFISLDDELKTAFPQLYNKALYDFNATNKIVSANDKSLKIVEDCFTSCFEMQRKVLQLEEQLQEARRNNNQEDIPKIEFMLHAAQESIQESQEIFNKHPNQYAIIRKKHLYLLMTPMHGPGGIFKTSALDEPIDLSERTIFDTQLKEVFDTIARENSTDIEEYATFKNCRCNNLTKDLQKKFNEINFTTQTAELLLAENYNFFQRYTTQTLDIEQAKYDIYELFVNKNKNLFSQAQVNDLIAMKMGLLEMFIKSRITIDIRNKCAQGKK